MNKVILIGRLTRDPEMRTTSNGLSVTRFTVAISRIVGQGQQPQTDFINCIAWRRQAENTAKYCSKGSQVAVEGRIQTSSYDGQDGQRRYTTEVVCDNVTFLGSPRNSNNGGYNDMGGGVPNYGNNNYTQPMPSYNEPINPSMPSFNEQSSVMPTTDITEDPFKDFGEEIALSDDDLPF